MAYKGVDNCAAGCYPVGQGEIAARLQVNKQTVYNWIHRGQFTPRPQWRVHGSLVWNWPDVLAWSRATGRGHPVDDDGHDDCVRTAGWSHERHVFDVSAAS